MIRNFLINTLAIGITCYILAVEVAGNTLTEKIISLLVISLVIAGLNLLVRPILSFISLPITILTLGLFSIVINAVIIKLADMISDGFSMSGWLSYIIFAAVLAIINVALSMFRTDND